MYHHDGKKDGSHMKKSLVLVLVLMLLLPFKINAESVQTGTFRFLPAFGEETEAVYYYSDDYFKNSSKEYNEHLLSMSFNLAISTIVLSGLTSWKNSEYASQIFAPWEISVV